MRFVMGVKKYIILSVLCTLGCPIYASDSRHFSSTFSVEKGSTKIVSEGISIGSEQINQIKHSICTLPFAGCNNDDKAGNVLNETNYTEPTEFNQKGGVAYSEADMAADESLVLSSDNNVLTFVEDPDFYPDDNEGDLSKNPGVDRVSLRLDEEKLYDQR